MKYRILMRFKWKLIYLDRNLKNRGMPPLRKFVLQKNVHLIPYKVGNSMIMFIFARSLSGGFSVMVLYRVLRHQQREYEREYWYLRYSA